MVPSRYHSCTGPIKDVPLHEFISYRGKSSTQSSPGYCLVAFGLRALDRRQPTKLHPPTGACNSSCTSTQYIAEGEPRPAQMMSHKVCYRQVVPHEIKETSLFSLILPARQLTVNQSVCLQTYHVVADPRCQKTKEILRAPPLVPRDSSNVPSRTYTLTHSHHTYTNERTRNGERGKEGGKKKHLLIGTTYLDPRKSCSTQPTPPHQCSGDQLPSLN